MRILLATATTSLLLTTIAFADEPVGCDKFKWPIERERAALTASNLPKLASATVVNDPPPLAATIALRSLNEAALPAAPERAPKPDTFAGFIDFKSITPGLYTINLSEGGWVDVLANGAFLKPVRFSGVTGCDGIRKSMKYRLTGPVVIQVSGVSADTTTLALVPSNAE